MDLAVGSEQLRATESLVKAELGLLSQEFEAREAPEKAE